jgi:sugar phosphate permease
LIQHIRERLGLGKAMSLTILGLGFVYALIPLSDSVWVVITTMFLFGFVVTIQNVLVWSYRHETTPAPLIGRVSGITGSIFKLGMPFAIFGAGYLTSLAGASAVFMICAAVQILVLVPFIRSCVMAEQ